MILTADPVTRRLAAAQFALNLAYDDPDTDPYELEHLQQEVQGLTDQYHWESLEGEER